jgi:hypothetical protein
MQLRGEFKCHLSKYFDLRASENPIAAISLIVHHLLHREQIGRNFGANAGSNS